MSILQANKLSCLLLSAALGLLVPTVFTVNFEDCGPNNVRQMLIQGCDKDTGDRSPGPCYVQRGKSLWFKALFVPDANYATAETSVEAKVSFLPPITELGVDKNACTNYLKCPLVKERPYWVNATFNVPGNIPQFNNVKVTIKLLSPANGNNRLDRTIACGYTRIGLK